MTQILHAVTRERALLAGALLAGLDALTNGLSWHAVVIAAVSFALRQMVAPNTGPGLTRAAANLSPRQQAKALAADPRPLPPPLDADEEARINAAKAATK